MVAVNDEDKPLTMTDGYVCTYNVYYDGGVTNAPIVLYMHGASGDRTNAASKMKLLRTLGFVTITMDTRGSGDGGGTTAPDWIGDNGFTSADYGWGIFNQRDIMDVAQVIKAVTDEFPTRVNNNKIGLAGTSRGAMLSWIIAGLGEQGKSFGEVRIPKISAIAPDSFHPNYAAGAVPPTRDLNGTGSPGIRGRTAAVFETAGDASHTTLASVETYAQTLFNANDPSDHRDAAIGVTTAVGVNSGFEQTADYIETAANSLPYDFPIFLTHDIDDRWGSPGHDLKFFNGRRNAFCLYGAHGGHGATDVLGEETRVDNKLAAFFRHFLKGETDVFGDYFDSDDASATRQVELLLTPNNNGDFINEARAVGDGVTPEPPPFWNSSYAWVSVFADNHQDLITFGKEGLVASETSLCVPLPVYMGQSTAVLTPPSGADWTTTITNTWTTATTATDASAAIAAATTSGSDVGTWYDGRLTHDTTNFQINWLQTYEGIYFGVARGKFTASASQPGAQLHARIQHSIDSGVTWVEVSNTWYVFAEDYTAGDIVTMDLDFDLRGMFLDGAAGGTRLVRIQFANYGKWDLGWVDGKIPVTIHPCYDDNTVTLYHGETYLSRVVLPMHQAAISPITDTHFQP